MLAWTAGHVQLRRLLMAEHPGEDPEHRRRLGLLLAALRKYLATASVVIDGVKVSGTQLATNIQAHLALVKDITAARRALQGMVMPEQDAGQHVYVATAVKSCGVARPWHRRRRVPLAQVLVKQARRKLTP